MAMGRSLAVDRDTPDGSAGKLSLAKPCSAGFVGVPIRRVQLLAKPVKYAYRAVGEAAACRCGVGTCA